MTGIKYHVIHLTILFLIQVKEAADYGQNQKKRDRILHHH
jgi:hypothetical protein